MTNMLQRAFDEASKLPPIEQDAIAALILDELADENRWQQTFATSQDQLSKLAEQTRQHVAAGRVKELGIDEL